MTSPERKALEEAAQICLQQLERDLPHQINGNQSSDYKIGYADACSDCSHAITRALATKPEASADLPALPPCAREVVYNEAKGYSFDAYTADQMRAYALAALSQPPAQAEPVGSIIRGALRPTPGPWCREVLLYSPNNMSDSPEKRVMLYASPPTAAAPDAKAAERYRWLRDSSRIPNDEGDGHLIVADGGGEDVLWAEQLDKRIDAAIANEGKP